MFWPTLIQLPEFLLPHRRVESHGQPLEADIQSIHYRHVVLALIDIRNIVFILSFLLRRQ